MFVGQNTSGSTADPTRDATTAAIMTRDFSRRDLVEDPIQTVAIARKPSLAWRAAASIGRCVCRLPEPDTRKRGRSLCTYS